ncbi:hypothetical protein [Paractinoplanes durhamensis]|uniref:DUF222 domain-containing protein n=1 Tax=Paractinoplanes durhamensis TaxID=113563 RepID=A0ABQ3YTJ3_9ACTN|nr:hypothetical protein [Actinoplanes durhamensis]GIE00868.1 hypothetical protein Adu01nite_22180 [Actinoplanes durhamensis]
MTDPDRRLERLHDELVGETAEALDLDAGLRDATLPARHEELVAEVAAALDLERGLAAILPRPAAEARWAISLPELASYLAGLDPALRLRIRSAGHDLANQVHGLGEVVRVRSELDEILDAESGRAVAALAEARRLGEAVESDLSRDGRLLRDGKHAGLVNALARVERQWYQVDYRRRRAVSDDLDLLKLPQSVHDLRAEVLAAKMTVRAIWSLVRVNVTRVVERAFTHLPDEARRDVRERVGTLVWGGEGIARGIAALGPEGLSADEIALFEQVCRNMAGFSDRVGKMYLRTDDMDNVATRLAVMDNPLARLRWATSELTRMIRIGDITGLDDADAGHAAELHRVLDDFGGTDLSHLDLTGVPLAGIRWSDTTRWPDRWAERIRRDSVPIGAGRYEIRPKGTTIGEQVPGTLH